jgi:hypothetical protein
MRMRGMRLGVELVFLPRIGRGSPARSILCSLCARSNELRAVWHVAQRARRRARYNAEKGRQNDGVAHHVSGAAPHPHRNGDERAAVRRIVACSKPSPNIGLYSRIGSRFRAAGARAHN